MLRTIAIALAVAVGLAAPAGAEGGGTAEAPGIPQARQSGYVAANGIDYYYAVYGEGEPLLLLHGGLGRIEMFGPVLAMLAEKRQVIGVDLHGHGRTGLGERPIDPVDMGEDMAVILDALGHDSVDVMGYSFGGVVALRLAIQHPEAVRRLALVASSFARDGFYPEILDQQMQIGAEAAEMMKDTPMYRSYRQVAPDPSAFPELLERMGALMAKPYNYADAVRELDMPVMLVYGDSDLYRPEHIVDFYQLLGGGLRDAGWQRQHMPQNRLAILPNLTHYDIGMAPRLAETVIPFFEGWERPTSWAEQIEAGQ